MKKTLLSLACGLGLVTGAQAGLFEDDDARRAILALQQRVEAHRLESERARTIASQASTEEVAALGRSLLDLQRQLELQRTDIAALRGSNERLVRELADLQRLQKEQSAAVAERFSKFEPVKVKVDGIEFLADPGERREFDLALATFRKSDFVTAQNLLVGFVGRYPNSGYVVPALFWLGNAQYATRDYKEAIVNFRALVVKEPEHVRAPEAILSVANCQMELKDTKAARKTLNDLVKAYPQSEAAVAAKERLAALK
jgi:tol-pal system protein YbgF